MNNEILFEKYHEFYGEQASLFFSAPGRSELIGNHSDHQHGRILSTAIPFQIYAAVKPRTDGTISIKSEGFEPFSIDVSELEAKPEERGTTISLVRGVAAGFGQQAKASDVQVQLSDAPHAAPIGASDAVHAVQVQADDAGASAANDVPVQADEAGAPAVNAAQAHAIPGFTAYITSEVPNGKGLSSSAAFEILIGRIINELGGYGKTAFELAVIGKEAENDYYGKPCGLQDQTVSAYGKTIIVDFFDPSKPLIEELPFNPGEHGYALCIIDTKASHANMTEDFASIIDDMRIIAEHFGVEHLRHLDEKNIEERPAAGRIGLAPESCAAAAAESRAVPAAAAKSGAAPAELGFVPASELYLKDEAGLAELYGSRAVSRAHHFINENRRVALAAEALKQDRFEDFLKLVNQSGRSSDNYLKNIVSESHPEITAVADTLELIRKTLNGVGAYRVHGGGFAGTTQAYVPLDKLDEFRAVLEGVLGAGSCIHLF